jgi:hypothetical protein
MLVTALLTTAAAAGVFRRFAGTNVYAVYPVALMAAYAVYEIALLAVAVAGLGGVENFAPRIVAEILFVNLVALVGLALLNRIAELTGLAPRAALAA